MSVPRPRGALAVVMNRGVGFAHQVDVSLRETCVTDIKRWCPVIIVVPFP
jgi:hypothetical protein